MPSTNNDVQNEHDVMKKTRHRRKCAPNSCLGYIQGLFFACELTKETRASVGGTSCVFGYIHNSKREAFFLVTPKSIKEIT